MNIAAKNIWQPVVRLILRVHHRLLPQDLFVGWMPYLWLVWVGYFFVPWGLEPTSIVTKAATIAALVIFLPLYFRFYWAQGAERLWIIGATVALGCALIPINGFCGGLLIYAAAFAGHCFRPRLALAALVTLTVVATVEYAGLGFQFVQWFWIPLIIMLIGLANVFSAQQKRQHYALRQSQDEVKRLAATAERERIARDLHDLLGHTLTLITVKAELAAKLAERDLPGAAREIRDVERISRETLTQVREAVGGYRSGGLAGEVINARIALETANISVKEYNELANLPASHDQLLALVLREAATNVVRHSGAHSCSIRMETANGMAHLYIQDDGRGGEFKEGHGIRGMRERLQIMNGRLDIRSEPFGTMLHASLPLQSSTLLAAETVLPAVASPVSS